MEYLFAAQFCVEQKQMDGSVGIAMQLKKGDKYKGNTLTAGVLKCSDTVKNIIHESKGFEWMKGVHGTPSY